MGRVVAFEIRNGEGATAIGRNLYGAGLIDDVDEFLTELRAQNLTGELLTGKYELFTGTDLLTLIDKITVHK